MKLNMMSNLFSVCSTANQVCEFIQWDFNGKSSDFSFYIDASATAPTKDNKLKFLWTLESPFFNGGIFDHIKSHLSEILETYELIFTYNDELLLLSEKFKWIPAMGSWITSPSVYKKSKLVSMIVSSKYVTPLQEFRIQYAIKNRAKIDVFGTLTTPIQEKETALRDYMFSVCVENAEMPTYFTEKILDCFFTGTIPVYKGARTIEKFFDTRGIIFLDDLDDISSLSQSLYESKLEYVKNNFEIAKNFLTPELYMYTNYLSKM